MLSIFWYSVAYTGQAVQLKRCEHGSLKRTSGHYATLMDTVSNSLVRNMHSSSLLKVILQGSSSAPSVPPWTQGQVLLLLLGWWPSTVLTISPCVMAGLLEWPPCSWDCAGTGQQVPPLTTSSKDNSRTHTTREKSVWRDKNGLVFYGHNMNNDFPFGGFSYFCFFITPVVYFIFY